MRNANAARDGLVYLNRSRRPRLRAAVVAAFPSILMGSVARADYTVTTVADNGNNASPTIGSLRWAIEQANANPGGTVDITAGLGTLTLTGQMPILSQAITINGNGNTISGNNQYRIFFIDAVNESTPFIFNNLILANGYAHGGNGGGGGGGGMGAGAAVFVSQGSVTLSSISFQSNSAVGGNGAPGGGGGGGGLDGNGAANFGGGGGLYGNGGAGDGSNYAGGGGGVFGNAANSTSSANGGGGGVGNANGANGGSGGGGNGSTSSEAGGGGGGTSAGVSSGVFNSSGQNGAPSSGGIGGRYGGGAGAVGHPGTGGDFGGGGGSYSQGGNGGFGGGGGSPSGSADEGGSGGFGAGAGAGDVNLSSGAFAGQAGFVGGGGAGLGAAVFVRAGASISFSDVSADLGSVTGGTGANDGLAYGSDFFLPGPTTFSVDAGNSESIIGTIADISASGETATGFSAATITKTGAGTLKLYGGNYYGTGANNYGGGTVIQAGILQVPNLADLGTGGVTFTGGTFQYAPFDPFDLSSSTVTLGTGGGTIDTNGSNVTFANSIGNSGSGSLTKVGAGTLTLASSDSYSGGTTIAAGALVISSDSALGGSSGTVTVGAATLQVANSTNFNSSRSFVLTSSSSTISPTGSPITLSGNITGNGTLNIDGNQGVTLSGTGSWTGGITIASGSGLTVTESSAFPTGSSIANNGSLAFNTVASTDTTGAIKGSGTISLGFGTDLKLAAGSGASSASALNNSPFGGVYLATLDITNNHFFINYGNAADPIASIIAMIKSGYSSGAWNGGGITSSTATANAASYGIGYADSADPGNPAGLSSGQIEIKYTLLGDANLDGKVNGSDFTIMAANFNKSGMSWDQGDFNYDGSVNGSDFVLLADNFNKFASQSAVDAADLAALDSFATANGISFTSVPEPTAVGVLAVLILSILTRRRRSVCRKFNKHAAALPS